MRKNMSNCKNSSVRRSRFSSWALFFSLVPISSVVLYFVFLFSVMFVDSGWIAFYGSVIFIHAIIVLCVLFGISGAVFSVTAILRGDYRARNTVSLILSVLSVIFGAVICFGLFSR